MTEKATDRAGWRIPEWGARYGLSRSTAYKLIKEGNGPRVARVPGVDKSIITVEADAEWRAKLDNQTAA